MRLAVGSLSDHQRPVNFRLKEVVVVEDVSVQRYDAGCSKPGPDAPVGEGRVIGGGKYRVNRNIIKELMNVGVVTYQIMERRIERSLERPVHHDVQRLELVGVVRMDCQEGDVVVLTNVDDVQRNFVLVSHQCTSEDAYSFCHAFDDDTFALRS